MSHTPQNENALRPFGSRTGLSRRPVIILSILYALWTLALLLMALLRMGAR